MQISTSDNMIQLYGKLTMDSVSGLVSSLSDCARSINPVTIDLSGVEEADSAAIALLINTKRIANQNAHSFFIKGWPDSLLELLALYGLDSILQTSKEPEVN